MQFYKQVGETPLNLPHSKGKQLFIYNKVYSPLTYPKVYSQMQFY